MQENLRRIVILAPALFGLTATSHAAWNLVDDFETGFTVGDTVSGINGWVADVPDRAEAANDPLAGSNGTVLVLNQGAVRNDVFAPLGSVIADGTTGTVFFEIFIASTGGVPNFNAGLGDSAAPDNFGGFEAQTRFAGSNIDIRDAGAFVDTGFDFSTGSWFKVWIVSDNATNTSDLYVQAPSGFTGQQQLITGYTFRNGAAANDLISFYTVQAAGRDAYVDNIYVDNAGQNLTDPTFVDIDMDTLDDGLEELYTAQVGTANLTDLTTPWDGSSSGSGSGDFDGDGVSDANELAGGTNPVAGDSDGDTLLDGAELNGSSNVFGSGPTNPLLKDTDGDGADDFEENGSLNTQFGFAATDPTVKDTDGDEIWDGYELENNTPGTALDPNDDGTTDPTQGKFGDRDMDGLFNIEEFDPLQGPNTQSPQTRADQADTDGDNLNDFTENNSRSWVSSTQTGTNPLNKDTDGDGLLDDQENLDLVFSAGTVPTNSDPNVRDTDFDGFIDSFEVSASTNPDDELSVPTRPAGFALLEDFEGDDMVDGTTFGGVNGWIAGDSAQCIVDDEPIEGGDQVGRFTRLANGGSTLYKQIDLLGLQIQDDGVGTLFYQLYCSTTAIDCSIGLSDDLNPTGFGNFEPQSVTFPGGIIRLRDAGVFRDVGFYAAATWMNVWIVADNAANTMKVYYESPAGESGQIEVTSPDGGDPFDFRNGTIEALRTAMLVMAGGSEVDQPIYIDNVYIDADAENLTTPADAKPVAVVPNELVVTSVARNGAGDLEITFSPGGATGYILTSASPTALGTTGFTEQANYTYDMVDTFTVPASFISANPEFFFRVEEAP